MKEKNYQVNVNKKKGIPDISLEQRKLLDTKRFYIMTKGSIIKNTLLY